MRHEYKQGNNSTHGENVYLKYYDRAGIEAANAINVYQQFADKREMPTKYGKEYTVSRWFRHYDRDIKSPEFAKFGFISSRSLEDVTGGFATLRLNEGADTGELVNLKKIILKTNLNRYGAMLTYTDEADLFSNDDIQVRYREELGEHANLLYEDLIQNDMLGTNTVMYAGAATSLATMGTGITADGTLDHNYKISYDFIRRWEMKLLRNRAEKTTSIVTGSNKVGSSPVNAAYYAIVGPEVKFDLDLLTRGKDMEKEFVFIPAYKYASSTNLAENEIGQMHDTRFVLSETAMVYRGKGVDVPRNYVGELSYTGTIGTDAKFDVFPILYPTKGSFATVGLKGHNKIVFHSKSPNQVEHSNPFGTKGFFSYNFWYAGVITQEEKLLKGLVLASR